MIFGAVFSHPSLSNHTDLICIGVGLCFVYIFISSSRYTQRDNSQSFLHFLDEFARFSINDISCHKIEKMDKIERLHSNVKYYLSKGKLKQTTAGSFQDIFNQIDRLREQTNSTQTIAIERIENRCEAKHLGAASLFIGLFGVFILFISEAEVSYNINILPFLFLSNLIIYSLLTICVISEYKLFKFKKMENQRVRNALKLIPNNVCRFLRFVFYPDLLKVLLFFIFAVIPSFWILQRYTISIFPNILYEEHLIHNQCSSVYPILVYLTILSLFGGFIAYFVFSLISSIRVSFVFRKKIKKSNLDQIEVQFNQIVESHRAELNDIDKDINDTVINPSAFNLSRKEEEPNITP